MCHHASALMHDGVSEEANRLFKTVLTSLFIVAIRCVALLITLACMQVIPKLSDHLDKGELRFFDNEQLVSIIHDAGVNYRFMGYVRNQVRRPFA